MLKILFCLVLIPCSVFAADLQVVKRGELTLRKPSFITLVEAGPRSPAPDGAPALASGAPPDLLVSSFDLIGQDDVFRVSHVAEAFAGRASSVSTLTRKVVWPNEVLPIDESQWGRPGYLISSGFLLPTKRTGAVSFLDAASGVVLPLTQPKPGYFYHRAVFADLSGAGLPDIITARGFIPFVGHPNGELVLLKRPRLPLQEPWVETVLAQGPDIHFRVFQDPSSGQWMAIAAEFSNRRLSLFWFENDGHVGTRIVDDTLGAPFDLEFFDLNFDGKPDLLVTNHQADATAGIFAYEIPTDLKHGAWIRHTLAQGIETRQKGVRQASPGVAKAFFAVSARAGVEKPWILVSGDGSQRLHLLKPLSTLAGDWRYQIETILDVKSTVGEPVIADFDQDGYADIVVPAYDINKLYFLSFRPADSSSEVSSEAPRSTR